MNETQRRAMFAGKRKTIKKYDKKHGITSISSKELQRQVIKDERATGKSLKKSKYIAGAVVGEQYRKKLKQVGYK